MSPFAELGQCTAAETEWNEAMAALRIEVEHGFGDMTRSWPFLNVWWIHKVFTSPIGHYYHVAVLLSNVQCTELHQAKSNCSKF